MRVPGKVLFAGHDRSKAVPDAAWAVIRRQHARAAQFTARRLETHVCAGASISCEPDAGQGPSLVAQCVGCRRHAEGMRKIDLDF
jgi:hypothetical protein